MKRVSLLTLLILISSGFCIGENDSSPEKEPPKAPLKTPLGAEIEPLSETGPTPYPAFRGRIICHHSVCTWLHRRRCAAIAGEVPAHRGRAAPSD